MKLILPMLGLFIYIGLRQKTLTRKVYLQLFAAALLVSLIFIFTWHP